jgi:hypothetical protein
MKKKYLIIILTILLVQCKNSSENRLNLLTHSEKGTVAVLDKFQKHIFGMPSSPDTIAAILSNAGMNVQLISAEALGDSSFLTSDRFDIVVLPYGQSFPVNAHKSFVKYLHDGGNFISMGGYAFTDLLKYKDGKWVKDTLSKPMNTAKGKNGVNILSIRPDQIGIFDASFPLIRAVCIKTAPNQSIVDRAINIEDNFTGWAASGVVGDIHNDGVQYTLANVKTDARWLPLLETYDRYSRPRGAAGAMLLHFNGFYKKSNWAYFGIDNLNLFKNTNSEMAKVLVDVAGFLSNKVFLGELSCVNRFYKSGEEVKVKAVVINRSSKEQLVNLKYAWTLEGNKFKKSTVETTEIIQPGEEKSIVVSLGSQPDNGDLWKVRGVLYFQNKMIDELTTGYVHENPEILKSSANLRFQNNYFTRDGRPGFLFGSDETAYLYLTPHENPLTWSRDILAGRDIGMTIIENLNYIRDGYQLTDWDWRNFVAMNQLFQKHNMVYMPGLLLIRNTTVGDSTLLKQTKIVEGFAKRLNKSPGLIYYLNGDYPAFVPIEPEETKKLWNSWLQERYGTIENLKKSWKTENIKGQWGELDFRRPRINNSNAPWDDLATIDTMRFVNWVLKRWSQTHTNGITKYDTVHPKISEFYALANLFDGRELGDGLDAHNFASWPPLENCRLDLCWFDLRLQWKGLGLGEYGSMRHPVWDGEGGPESGKKDNLQNEWKQKQLYSGVAHYALGLGGSRIQNWCLRDAQARAPFPWGLFYPETIIPKETAYLHRNLSILFRYFNLKYKTPELAVCLPYNMRVGKYHNEAGLKPGMLSFKALLDLHYDFGVIDDNHLQNLTDDIKFLIYPSPFTLTDETYNNLSEWVNNGGTLFITGDISYDENRMITRTSRLQELCGVRVIKRNYLNINRQTGKDIQVDFTTLNLQRLLLRPCVDVEVKEAKVLGKSKDGHAVLTKHSQGKGHVYYLTDPIELSKEEFISSKIRMIYKEILKDAKIESLAVYPDEPWIHVMQQSTETGLIHVIFNDKNNEGKDNVKIPVSKNDELTLNIRNKWSGLAAVKSDGRVIAVNYDSSVNVNGITLADGNGMKALVAIDGNDIRQSEAILALPFETGRLVLSNKKSAMTGILGDFVQGKWVEFDRVQFEPGKVDYVFDDTKATCILLICNPKEVEKWTDNLNLFMQHPEKITGM